MEDFKVNIGKPLPGFRFHPGECVVNSNFAEQFRQGKITPKDFDGMKMVVLEVGIDQQTGRGSYRLLYDSKLEGSEGAPWGEIVQWFTKIYVESNFEKCEYPATLPNESTR